MTSHNLLATTAIAHTATETWAWRLLVLFVFALPLSIAVSSIILTVLVGLWARLVITQPYDSLAPKFFLPLVVYAAWTLLSVTFSLQPLTSFIESKEVLLFLVVPVIFRLAQGQRASTIATVVLTVGAVAAVIGVIQYAILEYDNLGQRPTGSMGHYMTYSGLLMLIITVAVSRILFGNSERMWALIVLPALIVALVVTLTRNALLGACVGVSLLLVLKNYRLLVIAPIAAVAFFAVAPAPVIERFYSTFDLQDPTNRDRLAMVTAGTAMVRDHPITGVGPEMVQVVYADYRPPTGVNEINQHLHNVPLQIAAERGLPALLLWGWFVVMVVIELIQKYHHPRSRALAAAGLASVACMLTAGMFEYNFGDSEFLMLLLVLITLPAAALADQTSTEAINVESVADPQTP